MKIRCESCNKKFDPRKHDGVCPYCGAWHSIETEDRFDPPAPAIDPWDLPQQDASAEAGEDEAASKEPLSGAVTPAGEGGTRSFNPSGAAPVYGAGQPSPEGDPNFSTLPGANRRRGCGRFLWLSILLFVLSIAAFLAVPTLSESWVTSRATEQDRVNDLTLVEAEGGVAVAAPFSYRLVDARLVSYDGAWPMPEGESLLRVELAVLMSGEEPQWDPTDPYLKLEGGSYRMPIYSYDIEKLFPEDSELLTAFPYEVYWLETPSDSVNCVFYYLVPQGTAGATICFEQYAEGDFKAYLTQVAELPFAFTEEVSAE